MAELVIKNGTVVTPEGPRPLDMAVQGEKIAALGPRGTLKGAREIDAQGLVVLPGGIDTHVHFDEPGCTDWEDWAHGSRAAARGGITTVVDMPVDNIPPTVDGETLLSKKSAAEASSLVDFCLWGGLTREALPTLTQMTDLGAVGWKAFLCDCGGPYFPPADDGTLLEGLKASAQTGRTVTIHCEDAEMVDFYTALCRSRGGLGNKDWSRARPLESELVAVNKVLFMAELTGAKVNIAHISCAQAADLVQAAKDRGLPVTAETCAHYLCFDGEDVERRGVMLKCSPPIRETGARDALWQRVLEGKVDFVASDHSPSSPELKDRFADDMDKGWGGISGVQFTLNVLYTQGVSRRGLPLERLAQVFSSNAARALGLWGRKGALAEGFDADFVLFDPGRKWTVRPEDSLAKEKRSPYIGETFLGDVAATYLRGSCIYDRACPGGEAAPRGRMLCPAPGTK